MTELNRTPLFAEYEKSGAKTVNFGGWEMPVQFSGIKKEHEATRMAAGLFDVSHMGEILIEGQNAERCLQKLLTNDVAKLTPKRAQYTMMCYPDGGTVDDLIVYQLAEKRYLLVVNAANREKDYQWIQENKIEGVSIKDISDQYVQLAIQGPKAESILQKMTEIDLSAIRFFRFESDVPFNDVEGTAIVARTGYTGEDGFEIYIEPGAGIQLWRKLLEEGSPDGLQPVGLGARDTLRFEANLALYGQELSSEITPIEAGLGFAVKTEKEADFIGKDVLKKQKEDGPPRKLVGLEMIDKGIPRTGYAVFAGEEEIGFITTGTQSPTLKKNIGLALIRASHATQGEEVYVQVRKRLLKAKVVPTPFYKKS
ncbi:MULTISPECIES: glycine cleavage system aminomethyltransferase GcvT [Sediminibacillus]|uniref:glycine cleavage system aminomethyltransferase GcvT n=1 Tax=Sediminibacillus TaxID=482460 RepID=UPI00041C9B7D|nr:glycine cleavage system aminomethyltransferase GcvT [Sediminibacillus terrae]